MVGPHASAVPDDLIVNESVDFVAIGEFDYTVRDLVERLAKDIEDDGDGILGLWCNVDEKIIKNGPRDLIRNLDELPFASKAIFNHLYLNHYELDFTLHPYMDIMTSRGCPSKCTYCLWPQTITRGKYRMRSLENVFSEIEFTLSQNIKINEFFFDDDTFTIQPDRIKEFCARYSHMKTGIPFSVNSKANITDENLLMTMKKTGLRCLVVGFESGNQDILDNVKKGTRLIEMKTFADLCHKIGIQVHGDFVLGLTGETKETIDETIRFAKTLNLSTFQVSIAHPLPGTAFYNWLDEKGYITTHDYADWIDDNGAQNCIISYPNLSSEEIEESIDYAISKYYFSSHMLKTATRQILNDPHEIYRYARGAKRLARYFFNNSFSGDHFFKKS
jgi:radical SAM superfamily enzyme YgiQ (UPF0313 family)